MIDTAVAARLSCDRFLLEGPIMYTRKLKHEIPQEEGLRHFNSSA